MGYHDIQEEIFFEDKEKRFKVIAKGRRFGLTHGFAKHVIDQMLAGITPVLWVDTIYGNIERYFRRYFEPDIKKSGVEYKFRSTQNDLVILRSICDFRSADKPENLEGFGYKLIILNEAGIILKNKNLWLESIYPMTLDYKDSKVIIGGTPKGKYHKNEKHLFYELFQKGKPHPKSFPLESGRTSYNNEWKSYQFSTYDNPLLDKQQIKDLENDIPVQLRRQEIHGEFADRSDEGIIKSDWWKYYTDNEYGKEKVIKRIAMWDTAFKKNQENDFSVCGVWVITSAAYYLDYVFRERMEFPDLKSASVDIYENQKVNEIWIEDKASGTSLIQELKRETRIPVKPIKANQDKIEYVNSITPLLKSGKVFIKESEEWTEPFLRECEDFPYGEFDDQVDVLSKFLNEAKNIKMEFDINNVRAIKTKVRNKRR
ncbi:phage terminase, large subunit [hydrocarbon metagenome]|uniref:Phage terminase, large subunit n=1 Tax=hydrocarbon metagenome TaxID=938273 RepID=A0A0W8G0T4_9ZZZZ